MIVFSKQFQVDMNKTFNQIFMIMEQLTLKTVRIPKLFCLTSFNNIRKMNRAPSVSSTFPDQQQEQNEVF